MAIRDTIRAMADRLGIPAFSGTPFPEGKIEEAKQLVKELGGTGTFNFGGFLRGEDFNPDMDSLTAIKNLDIMRRSDAQTNAALNVIMQPIRSADKSVDPAKGPNDETTPADEQVAKFVEWNLFSGETLVWDDFLRQALLMLVFGHYVFEKVWDIQKRGQWAGKLYYRKLAPRPPKTIWQWFIDESGELLSIKQLAVKAGTYQFLDIPASKLVVFVHNKEGDNYQGISVLRSAYPHWLIKNNLYVVDAIRAVRFGAGIPKAKLLKGYSPTRDDQANLVNTLMGMSSHQFSYIIEPESVDISILVPQGAQGGAQILPTIEHHNQQITRNVLATFLDMGGRDMGGSNALGSSAMDFFANAVISIGDLIEDVINKQIIRQLVDANFDIDQLSGYPTFRFSGIKKDNLKDLAGIVTSLAGAGMVFSDIETQNTFRNLMGLPEVTEAQVAAAGPQAPLPGGATPPVSGDDGSAPSAASTPRTPPTNQNPQGMRPAVMPSGAAAQKTAVTNTTSQAQRTVAVPANNRKPVVTSVAKTTASSGDADEEDHTSGKKLSEAPSQFWRSPTELETRVLDLSEMPRKLDTARDVLLGTLRSVREEQALRIAELVAPLPVGATAPKPPLMGKLVSDTLRIVKDMFEYGSGAVESELRKQGKKDDPVGGLQFAEGTDMPFPVELSNYPEPTPDQIEHAPVQTVSLDKLIATQPSLTMRRILPKTIDSSLPILVRHGGLTRIYDGHHRLSSKKLAGETVAECRVVAMRELALAAPKQKDKAWNHLKASVELRVRTASERLVSAALHEALRLKRSGWSVDEIEDALKIFLGDISEADIIRLANTSVNEAFALGRTTAAEMNVHQIGKATLSALMDSRTCRVCRSLDGKSYKIGSDAYEEHLPPVQGCKGRDHCRCVYIYTFSAAAFSEIQVTEEADAHIPSSLSDTDGGEVALGGPGSGWTAEDGHVPGSQGGTIKKKTSPETVALIHKMHAEGHSKWKISKAVGMYYSQVDHYLKKAEKNKGAAADSIVKAAAADPKVKQAFSPALMAAFEAYATGKAIPPSDKMTVDTPAAVRVEHAKDAKHEWVIGHDTVRKIGEKYPSQVQEHYEGWLKGLSANESDALVRYCGSGYAHMNGYLRGTTDTAKVDKLVPNRVNALQNALKRAPAPPPPELVWRGIANKGGVAFAQSLKPGDTFELKGFTSTSINPSTAVSWSSGGALFEIKPKAGAYVRSKSPSKGEYEFLMNHGSKYRVAGVRMIKFYHPVSGSHERTVVQVEEL